MIKRYNTETILTHDDSIYPDMEESPKGDYVKYSDHVEIVKDLLEDLWYLSVELWDKSDPLSLHLSKQYQDKYMRLKKEYGL